MRHACIYARYSTDSQQPTSIEDQVRRCRALAAREGLTVEEDWVYSDEAITGRAEGSHKRVGYQRMLDAWDSDLVDVVYADEVSRFSRDLLDGASLMRRVERTGVRIVTGDGIDTRQEGWQVLWTMRLAMSTEELRSMARRTARSMEGLLERGLMIAAPPYGYGLNPHRVDANGERLKGAQWVIDETQAAVVRDMFRWRKSGLSAAGIARRLNEAGIPCPRTNGAKRPGYWRPATVHRMLGNTIYRGVFMYLGSGPTRAKLAKVRQTPKVKAYDRPQFRLVDDALWEACNQRLMPQRVRGGTKHLFANLLQCGDCGCSLCVGGTHVSRSLHCPQCEQAVRVGEREAFIGYTSVSAARQALEHALRALFTGAVREEFAARLRARLVESPSLEEERLKARKLELERNCQRLLQLGRREDIGIEFVGAQLAEDKAQLDQVKARLKTLAQRNAKLSKAEVDRQLAVDPQAALTALLDGAAAPVHEVRATLKRLIQSFRFVARAKKFHAVFEIRFVPGALVADLAHGEVLDHTAVTFRVHTKSSARRPPVWEVQVTRVA